jgi:hypothetical protein
MAYQAPTRDQTFLLQEVLRIEQYGNLPGFADASMDLVSQWWRPAALRRRGAGARSTGSATVRAARSRTAR